jgi:hypothetical protein
VKFDHPRTAPPSERPVVGLDVEKAEYSPDPYPHVVVDDAFGQSDALESDFPEEADFPRKTIRMDADMSFPLRPQPHGPGLAAGPRDARCRVRRPPADLRPEADRVLRRLLLGHSR